MIKMGSSAGTLTDHRGLSSLGMQASRGFPPEKSCAYAFVCDAASAWIYLQPGIIRQTITDTTTPVRSAIRPAATAWRVRRTATEPKYTANT